MNHVSSVTVPFALLATLLVHQGCSHPEATEDSQVPTEGSSVGDPAQPTADAPAAEASATPQADPTAWTRLRFDSLTDTQRERYDRAELARRTLGSEMMGRVVSVAATEGYPAAINVCSQEARGMAADVAQRFNVNIGRTSLRLRNTANSAPAWAVDHIQANADSAGNQAWEYIATNGEGTIGVLSPITIGTSCLNCHGTPDALAPGVGDLLAQLYPTDTATGFAEGDLRGWFWVEAGATE